MDCWGIRAVWQPSFNNSVEKCRWRRWKSVCSKCLKRDESSWAMVTLLGVYCEERGERMQGKTESTYRYSGGVSTQTQSVCSLFCMSVSGTHSTGVKYRDSPHGSKVSYVLTFWWNDSLPLHFLSLALDLFLSPCLFSCIFILFFPLQSHTASLSLTKYFGWSTQQLSDEPTLVLQTKSHVLSL